MTHLGLGVGKKFNARGVEWLAQFQLFNVINVSTILYTRSNNFGTATYDLPSEIWLGRLPRLSLQMKW